MFQWVLKPENSLVWHREVISWINKYSGVEEEQAAAAGSNGDAVDGLVEDVQGAKIW